MGEWQGRCLETAGVNGTEVTLSGLAAERAESFDVQVRAVGGEYEEQASAVDGPEYVFPGTSGDFEARVAGRNANGLGPWSELVGFSVA